jgi:hypothetical protein
MTVVIRCASTVAAAVWIDPVGAQRAALRTVAGYGEFRGSCGLRGGIALTVEDQSSNRAIEQSGVWCSFAAELRNKSPAA